MRLVLVTGANRGLGASIVKTLLNNNFKVFGVGRTVTDFIKQTKMSHPDSFFFQEFDLSETGKIHLLIKGIIKEHGHIYGLINNAALGHDGVLATMHESQISDLLKVNIQAPILLTKYASRSMLLKRTGRVINIGSIMGATGFSGLSVYGATKASLGGFTKSLSRELGKVNITVNTVAPGYMATEMTAGLVDNKLASIVRRSPLGRLAQVADVADMVNYLLSDSAKNITGSTITIDAGSTA
jgi:3-oxoacyl-[acyl-carrier protein] reductase